MKSRIPFSQLWLHQQENSAEVSGAVARVFQSGTFVLGEEVCAFEREFCNFLGARGGIGVASGTDAITLGLLGGKVGRGDEVLVPAFAPGATITGVISAGATPVLVDVLPDTGLDLTKLEQSLTPRTRALIVVHLYGRVDSMTELLRFARHNGLWMVEDCAQAQGARFWDSETCRWRHAGTMGDVGAFSFYPTKNLGGPGDGGFVCASNEAVLDRLRALRQYGWEARDQSVHLGRNSRLDEIQAAVLRTGLPKLAEWNKRRRDLAKLYERLLPEEASGVFGRLPKCYDSENVFHLYVVKVKARDRIIECLNRRGVGFGVHYPFALAQQPAYRAFGKGKDFSVSEELARNVLSLPMYPSLREDSIEEVARALKEGL